jgi:hypothetical protein
MVAAARWVCASKPYRLVARRVVLPWALNGGTFVGYDPLDGPITRLLHCGEGSAVRMMRRGQLDVELAQLPATHARTSTSFGGLVMRFAAAKAH